MFNMFRKFLCCNMPSRSFGWTNRICKCTREVLDINEINYKELLEMVKTGALLIDVRTKQEFLEGHLEGSTLIPYFEISKKISGITYDKEQEIILYCKNGGRSVKAYKVLRKMGYSNIYNLKGGIDGI